MIGHLVHATVQLASSWHALEMKRQKDNDSSRKITESTKGEAERMRRQFTIVVARC